MAFSQPKSVPPPPLPLRFTKNFQAEQRARQKNAADSARQAEENRVAQKKFEQAQADAITNAPSLEKKSVLDYYVSIYGARQGERYKDLYFLQRELENEQKNNPGSTRTFELQKSINGIQQSISRTVRSPSGNKSISVFETPTQASTGSILPTQEPIFVNGEPVIYAYSSGEGGNPLAKTGGTVYVTNSGSTSTQFPAQFATQEQLQQASFNPPQQFVSQNLPPTFLPSSFVVGGTEGARFTPFTEKFSTNENPNVLAQARENFLAKQAEENRLNNFGLFRPALDFSQDVSEGLQIVGQNTFRGLADTGRKAGVVISSNYLSYTSQGLLRDVPLLTVQDDERGVPQLRFIPGNQRPNEYVPYANESAFRKTKEQGAIVGGALFALAPYTVGGPVLYIQRAADIGSAIKKNPAQAASLVATGIATTVLFNEAGLIGRVVKGQLGGTIAGSIGFSKNFEDITQTGGKILGIGLLAPYVAQEAFGVDLLNPTGPRREPNLLSSFEKGDSESFRQGVTSLQRTAAPLYLGSQIGQRVATGFTLFSGPNAITFGGTTKLGGGENLVRKRLIANTFDATYTKPTLTGSQKSFIGKAMGVPGVTEKEFSNGKIKISFPEEMVASEDFPNTKKFAGKTITVTPPKTPFQVRQFFESKGFTKQSFLESETLIFSTLKGKSVPVKEYDPSKIKAISRNTKAQEVLLKYLQENKGEFAIYGSGSQGPQLDKVKVRLTGDLDIIAYDPKKFELGLLEKFGEAGFSKKDFHDYVSKKQGPGEVSIAAGPGNRKFLNIHSVGEDKFLFPQLETVADFFPRNVFVETPSGIRITELRFQAERKIVGGFVPGPGGLRGKDLADVLTITKSINLSSKEIGIPLQSAGGASSGIFGDFQFFSGVKPPSSEYVKEFRALESQAKALRGSTRPATRLDVGLVKGLKGRPESQQAIVELYREYPGELATGGSAVTGSNITSKLSNDPADLDIYLKRGSRQDIRSRFREIIKETGSDLVERRGRFYEPGVKKAVIDFPDYQKAITNIRSTLDFGETISSRIQNVTVYTEGSFEGKGGGTFTDPEQAYLVKLINAKKGYIGGSGALTVGVKGFRQPGDIEGYFKNTNLTKVESLSRGFAEKLSAEFGGDYTVEVGSGKVKIITPEGKTLGENFSKPSSDVVVQSGDYFIRSPELIFSDKQNIVKYAVLENRLGKSVEKSISDIASIRNLIQGSTGVQTDVISPYTLSLRSVYGGFQTAGEKELYRYSKDIPRFIQSVSNVAISEKAIPVSNFPIIKQLDLYNASRFLDFVQTNYPEAAVRSQVSSVPNRPLTVSLFKPGFFSTFSEIGSSLPAAKGFVFSNAFSIAHVKESIQDSTVSQAVPSSVSSSVPADSRFELNLKGKIETTFGIYPKGTLLKDISNIGVDSVPVKSISTITGRSPSQVVKSLGELRVEGITGSQLRSQPDLIAGFGFEKTGEPAIGFRSIFQPGIPSAYNTPVQRLGILSHELTHAGESAAGINENTAGLRGLAYTFSGAETRARAVQEAFLESRGATLPFGDFMVTRTSDIRPYGTGLVQSSGNDVMNSFVPRGISGSSSIGSSSGDYYPAPTRPSYPIYYPVLQRQGESYYPVAARSYPVAVLYPVSTVYPTSYAAPTTPYVPPYVPSQGYSPKYSPPAAYNPPSAPYTPPYVPPVNPIPPYVPPPVRTPPYVPPPNTRTPTTPFVPGEEFPSFKRKNPFGAAFKIVTKIGGKPKDVPGLFTQRDAFAAGTNLIRNTLRASFKVLPAEGFAQPRGITAAPVEGYFSKAGFFVQRIGTRLGTRGEVSEIQIAKKKSNYGKPKKFKSGFFGQGYKSKGRVGYAL